MNSNINCSYMARSSLTYIPAKNDSFSFYLSIAVLLLFLYLIAAYASVRQCAIIICRCPQNIIEISLSRKNVHRNMLSKMPEM
jgi:multidrug efflux pump subunit AcrB